VIVYIPIYTRELIQKHPNCVFVFGDNVAEEGYGGQAAEARGEPNALGIPTKLTPHEYLTDEHFDDITYVWDQLFEGLHHQLDSEHIVVWPLDGIGTGLAKLREKAPRCWAHLKSLCLRCGIRNGP